MTFDIVIGNPPYQDISGRANIYHKFIEKSVNIADTVCMITRDNWINGKAFRKTRDIMLKSGEVSNIVHYPTVGELFKGVRVSTAYFLWSRLKHNKDTLYKCIRNNKVVMEHQLNMEDGIIYKSLLGKEIITRIKDLCNWDGNTSKWGNHFNTRSYPFMDKRKRFSIEDSTFKNGEYNVKLIANNEDSTYVSIENFLNKDEVINYNIMCGGIINEASLNNPGNVLTNIKIIGPYEVTSETWSLIATFYNKDEAENCLKYVKTKLFRFLTNQTVNGRSNVTDNVTEFVPLQNFTSNSDIDWSQTIDNIDKQLYKKYKLTDNEIKYIEDTIKPIK